MNVNDSNKIRLYEPKILEWIRESGLAVINEICDPKLPNILEPSLSTFDHRTVQAIRGIVQGYNDRNNYKDRKLGDVAYLNFLGMVYGECFVETYGFQWAVDHNDKACVAYPSADVIAYPLSKVRKHAANGFDDDIIAMWWACDPTQFESLKKRIDEAKTNSEKTATLYFPPEEQSNGQR